MSFWYAIYLFLGGHIQEQDHHHLYHEHVWHVDLRKCSFKFRGILGLSIVVYVLCPVVPWASSGEPVLIVDSCPFGSGDLTSNYGRSNLVLCCRFSVCFFGELVLSPNRDFKILIYVASIFLGSLSCLWYRFRCHTITLSSEWCYAVLILCLSYGFKNDVWSFHSFCYTFVVLH
jgi:hypothetical protein